MNELLALALEAHGGLPRWQRFTWFRAEVSITGALWASQGWAGSLDPIVLHGETRNQRVILAPFPFPGWYATWEPHRQTIETAAGIATAERRDPAASFGRGSPSDDFQVAYLAAEAVWNYLAAPFVLARTDFLTEEIAPGREGWRRLLVTYPDDLATHSRQQIFSFDDTGLLRRLDYTIDLLGGGPAVHYPSDYQRFDGIQIPTRRRVYVADSDGRPVREPISVEIGVDDVAFR
ncbi:hypothetical protein [Cryptosporangium minutisporangium]|uniref:Uncharacterized protein n=1 Tax=Cryptosporangium minutisporangium TaxID=113569 RepID=A0ABP6SRR1_9ACTN